MEKLCSNDDIKANIEEINNNIKEAATKAGRDPNEITLLAATKTVAPEYINMAINNGITTIGESRAQELERKIEDINTDNADVHFIGALQSNKVRQIIDKVSLIHSLDRISLVKEIEKQAKSRNMVMDVLIQVNIGLEDSKSGIKPSKLLEFADKVSNYEHVNVRGLMAIPPICEDKQLTEYFEQMKQHLVDIQRQKGDNSSVNILSMGMSGDYQLAVAHGATIVRVGSSIFGARQYK